MFPLASIRPQSVSIAHAFYPLPSVGPTVLLHDAASGVAATTISGRTPDIVGAGTWSFYTSNSNYIGTDSAKFRPYGATGTKYAFYDVGVTAYTYTLKITPSTWTAALVRYGDNNNHWDCGIRSTGTPGLYIRERTSGSATTRAFTSGSFSDGVEYDVTIEVTGTDITMTVGAVVATYSSTSKAANTSVGIVPLAGSEAHRWDDIKVAA